MNEIIANLYNQAIVIEDGGDYVCGELDPEKFAELIVGECARIGELKEQGCKDYAPDLSVGWYMKQHFGVSDE